MGYGGVAISAAVLWMNARHPIRRCEFASLEPEHFEETGGEL
jgi:hypothetical protein